MFDLTAKMRRFKLLIIAILAVFLIIFAVSFLFREKVTVSAFSQSTVADTAEKRISFLTYFGWDVDDESESSQNIVIPRTFPPVYDEYNKIQLSQGCDLRDYSGLEVVRYTYEVKNYPNYDGAVYAELLVYKNVIIGGDIHSAALDGFIHGLSFPG